ncbi:hypothetical protein, partial [Nocardia sp. NPDC058497]|uniref:hypothetical protein n=1 Tax=Nocardia sp. NPDC058497 TaxID=3346529 RepID=UPI0036564145
LRNNTADKVHIIRMTAIKDCGPPIGGTYIRFPTQGGATFNEQLGVNLDAPRAYVQEYQEIPGGGIGQLVGDDYFKSRTIVIDPGDSMTFSVTAMVTKYACTFHLEASLSARQGASALRIDQGGKPFRISAQAPPRDPAAFLSGYDSVYLPEAYPSPNVRAVAPSEPGK